jgi:hypothetical protein
VARIRGEMDQVIASHGFKGTFAEFVQFLNSDPRFFFKTAEERLRAYRDIAKRADAELPKLFAELPRTPYGIRAMEAYEGDNADHYSRPALDGSRAGFFDANGNNLQDRPSLRDGATLLHEAVPGHHLQIARAQELQGPAAVPPLRRLRRVREGWALYAESLGYEMGFYKDPYSASARCGRERARLPPGDRHRHPRQGLERASSRSVHDRQRRGNEASPTAESTATSSCPARRSATRSASCASRRCAPGRRPRSASASTCAASTTRARRRRAAAHGARGAHRRLDRRRENRVRTLIP